MGGGTQFGLKIKGGARELDPPLDYLLAKLESGAPPHAGEYLIPEVHVYKKNKSEQSIK